MVQFRCNLLTIQLRFTCSSDIIQSLSRCNVSSPINKRRHLPLLDDKGYDVLKSSPILKVSLKDFTIPPPPTKQVVALKDTTKYSPTMEVNKSDAVTSRVSPVRYQEVFHIKENLD